MPQQPKEIFVRTDRCMGCHSCEMACAVAHSQGQSLYAALSEKPTPKPRLYVEWVAPKRSVPIVCRQCEDPACMHACITGAISRNPDGVVTTDKDRCIGCWTCVMVCSYGVIGRHLQDHTAYRCDRCPDRDVPACVDACPTQTLVYQSAAEFARDKRKSASKALTEGQGV
jgi:carbon-monoxide dehydrogenase iron sulfur subunit